MDHEEPTGGGQRRVLIAGLGKRDELDAETARVAAAAAAGRAAELGATSLSWAAPDGLAGPIVEGTLLKLYKFDRFKSKQATTTDEDKPGSSRSRSRATAVAEDDVERARVIASAQNAARDLQNLPANVADPTFLAGRAEEIADQHDTLELELLDREAIAARGHGRLHRRGAGHRRRAPPDRPALPRRRLRAAPGLRGQGRDLRHRRDLDQAQRKMSEMKFDMSGGAAVLESMGAIAALGLPVTITAVVPATENMPSGRSVKPGDIVTAMNGKTIEINNTDAEGRLILADALSYAVEQGVERIVDLATLTGAIIVALGSTHAGLFSNDDDWCGEVDAACDATGEIGLATATAQGVRRARQGQLRGPRQRARGPQGLLDHCRGVPQGVRRTTFPGCTWTSPARPGASDGRTSGRAPRASACAR